MMASFEVLAEESYKELLNLLEWFSHFSLIPTLIGGWAVFVYNSYFGSVDIDIVGPSMGGHFLDVIERYERAHGYEEVKPVGLGIEVTYRKPITKQGRVFGYVEIDVCTFEADTGSFHEDPNKKLDTTLLYVQIDETLFKETNDEFTVKAAKTPEEIKSLPQVGFEYVCQKGDMLFFRKRK